jgi:hypothetical protein
MFEYHVHKAQSSLFDLLRHLVVVRMALSYELRTRSLVKFETLRLRLALRGQLANVILLPLAQSYRLQHALGMKNHFRKSFWHLCHSLFSLEAPFRLQSYCFVLKLMLPGELA